MNMRSEVQIEYKLENESEKRFASIRLRNMSIDAITYSIEKKLKQMHPLQKKKIEYVIIGIS